MAEITVGRWSFPTKTTLRERLRKAIEETPTGEPLRGEEAEILYNLLEMHPQSKELLKSTVLGFVVEFYGYPSSGGKYCEIVYARKGLKRRKISIEKIVSEVNKKPQRSPYYNI